MSKYRNEQLNRVLMSRRSVVFKDKKHPTGQKLKQQLKNEKGADRSAGSVMMTPIVIDLEWNRSFPGRRPVEDLPNEIIQIGAVLLDDNYMEQDSFQMYVKPVFSEKLRRSIVDLTGITDEKLLSAPRFEKAMKAFFEWCLHCEDKVQVIQWSENDYLQIIDEISLKKYIPTSLL